MQGSTVIAKYFNHSVIQILSKSNVTSFLKYKVKKSIRNQNFPEIFMELKFSSGFSLVYFCKLLLNNLEKYTKLNLLLYTILLFYI